MPPVHFLHLSTAASIDLVRRAKADGLAVTAEAAPHHFTLTDAVTAGYDPVFKVNPPLRPQSDVDAVRAGLADGTIDAIATDHAPHTPETKDLPFDQAPPGMLGLETALALAITQLDLPLARILALLSWQPAAVAGLAEDHGGPIVPGAVANLCVIDPSAAPGRVDATARQPQPQPEHAVRGPDPDREGTTHGAAGYANGVRVRGAIALSRDNELRQRVPDNEVPDKEH